MVHRSRLVVASLPLVFAASLVAGRSFSSTARPSVGGDGGTSPSDAGPASPDAACDDGGLCTVPPPPPSGPVTTGTTPQSFALHHVHLGDEPGTCTDGTSWCQYGYNLDGKDTTAASTNVCTPHAGAGAQVQVDGPGGIDNSFGPNIVNALVSAVLTNPSPTEDTSIGSGAFTFMVDVTGLTPDAGQSATGLQGMLFGGVAFGQGPNVGTAVPTFTTADDWPIDPSFVTSTVACTTLVQPVTSRVTFSGAYVTGGVFVSGAPVDMTLNVLLQGFPLALPLRHATITFSHPGALDAGTADTHISSGVISGIVDAQDLMASIDAIVGNYGICSGSNLTQVNDVILQAADIMDDGTNAPGVPCNGISVGIGFDADEIGQPQVVGAPPSIYNPCDGGSSSGSAIGNCGGDSGADSGSSDDAGAEASTGSSSGGEAGTGGSGGSSSGGDAGGPDAAAPVGVDGGGGAAQTASGCSCQAVGADGSPGGIAFAALALVVAARRRRRG
jgi:MYXO-CTERM domain-containing protein